MPPSAANSPLTVALIGNPNTGKSTLFGALAGVHQRVGNYPGVTVEKKTGRMNFAGEQYELIDLPGLYSLAPRSRDEMVAVDLLLGRQLDSRPVEAAICIVDAANLERNLYLASQVLELGVPTVLAVNMLDVARARGITINLALLAKRLGIPVVGVQANRRMGIADLKIALATAVRGNSFSQASRGDPKSGQNDASPPGSDSEKIHAPPAKPLFPPAFEASVAKLREHASEGDSPLPAFLARRLLLETGGYLERRLSNEFPDEIGQWLAAEREWLSAAGCPIPGVETAARYDWSRQILEGIVAAPAHFHATTTDRIDRVLTHRLWGLLAFAFVMLAIFQSVFVWASPLMNVIERLTEAAGGAVESAMAEGAFRSLLAEGLIGGVGAVFVFLPQILVLFFFLAILEDCGYMARAAFLMDRLMSRVGLSGKSFIPMLSSFACAVPGIMATRVIENERDRLTTILVAPLLTCSARLPIYALLIAAFVPDASYLGGYLKLQGLVLAALYALGIFTAVAAAMLMKRTITRGPILPFMLELPSYKWPSPRTVALRVGERCRVFLRNAGTLILIVSIAVWAALYFPHDRRAVAELEAEKQALRQKIEKLEESDPAKAAAVKQLERVRREIEGAYQRDSILGRAGRFIEPAVKPLGWDWRIGCAVLASFPAREVVVATLGVIFNAGEDDDPNSDNAALKERLHAAAWPDDGRPLFTLPTALSVLVFFALCAQCAATLAVIRRETNSWRWPAFTFGYMTALAYIGALVTYQLGTWLGS
ncbi:MAG: ferrous iron transporter B [Pirellulales bacterium]|nr:ferrous iron transporter B [Pirellulales bacterium]